MKPREFWIGINNAGAKKTYDHFPAYDVVAQYSLDQVLHVREVVPIDWERVWDSLDLFMDYENQKAIEKKIQDRVEKAIKGKLE